MNVKKSFVLDKNSQSGQILLISLLVLVLAMIIGLSVAVRTLSVLRTSEIEDNSKRAFSAAEAGIEQALTENVSTSLSGSLSNNSSYSTSVSTLSGSEFLVNNGDLILKDDIVDIWLSAYPDYTSPWDGTISIYWGNSGDSCNTTETSNTMAALEVVLISGTKNSPSLTTYAFDPCTVRRSSHNLFGSTGSGRTVSGRAFTYSANITVTSGLLMRVIPLYAGSYIGVSGTNLPAQGTVITSVGTSGDTQRKIVTYRSYPKAPVEFFPFLLFSPK